jgi:putative DNA primase/helicase
MPQIIGHNQPRNKSNLTLADVLQLIETRTGHSAKKARDGWITYCPVHEADGKRHNPSLSVRSGTKQEVVLYCHAGCSQESVIEAAGLSPNPVTTTATARPGRKSSTRPIPSQGPALKNATTAISERSKADDPPFQLVETYYYHNADGVEVFAVDRKERIRPDGRKDKTFLQWQKVNGEKVWNVEGVPRLPYRLPQLIERSTETVWIVEGEKDVHSLEALGLLATCNPGGAGKWGMVDPSSLTVFRGRDVCILPDNDDPGRRHAEEVARSVTSQGAVARIVTLPGLSDKGDISNWIEAGGTREGLETLATQAEIWTETTTTTAGNVLTFPKAVEAGGQGGGKGRGREFLGDLTETGNAEKIATTGRGRIAWVNGEAWYGWNGKQWERTHATAERIADTEIPQQWAELAMALAAKGEEYLADQVWKWHRKSRSYATVKGSLASAQKDLSEEYDSFDQHPAEINAANGIIDLTTGELRPHDPGRRHTRILPVAYDPDATCPRWIEALHQIFKGRSHLVRYFQTYAGYSLTGEVTDKSYLLLHGSGDNGKSLVLNVLGKIWGPYALALPSTTLMASRESNKDPATPTLARLRGARLATSSEVTTGAKFDDVLMKKLTGGDPVAGRHMYGEGFQFLPTHKLWLACNHKPRLDGADPANVQRIRLLPFEAKFAVNPTGDQYPMDKKLGEYLITHELPGILAWLVHGAIKFYANPAALEAPAEVAAASRAYALENDPLGQFLSDRCEVGEEDLSESLRALRSDFNRWLEAVDEGAKPWSSKRLSFALESHETEKGVKKIRKVKRNVGAVMVGVKLLG